MLLPLTAGGISPVVPLLGHIQIGFGEARSGPASHPKGAPMDKSAIQDVVQFMTDQDCTTNFLSKALESDYDKMESLLAA